MRRPKSLNRPGQTKRRQIQTPQKAQAVRELRTRFIVFSAQQLYGKLATFDGVNSPLTLTDGGIFSNSP